jgi:hypothetical protein
MKNPSISVIEDEIEGCGKGVSVLGEPYNRVCYSIETEEEYSIRDGEIQLEIFNTVNQKSVSTAGEMEIKTQ